MLLVPRKTHAAPNIIGIFCQPHTQMYHQEKLGRKLIPVTVRKLGRNSVTVFPVAVCENAMYLFSENHIFGHIVKVKGRMKVKLT